MLLIDNKLAIRKPIYFYFRPLQTQ